MADDAERRLRDLVVGPIAVWLDLDAHAPDPACSAQSVGDLPDTRLISYRHDQSSHRSAGGVIQVADAHPYRIGPVMNLQVGKFVP